MKCFLVNIGKGCCFEEDSFVFLIEKIKENSPKDVIDFIKKSIIEMNLSGKYFEMSSMDRDIFNKFYSCCYNSMVLFSQTKDKKIPISEKNTDFLRDWQQFLCLMREDPRHMEYEMAWKEKGLPPEAIIFYDSGITILKKEGKFYARHDTGALFGEIKETEISEEDARMIQKREKDAFSLVSYYEKLGKTRILPPGQS